jgi:hypothetical protein
MISFTQEDINMVIRDDSKAALEAFLRLEFERIDRRDSGRPMTLREMENMVTEFGQRLQEKMLTEVIEEQKVRSSTEKKTARSVAKSGIRKGSGQKKS